MFELLSTLYNSPVIEVKILQEVMANVVAALLAELNNASQQVYTSQVIQQVVGLFYGRILIMYTYKVLFS